MTIKGCELCPYSEKMWMEGCRLASLVDVEVVIARGLRMLPHSVNLWIEDTNLELDHKKKRRVDDKGLEHVPNSDRLWNVV